MATVHNPNNWHWVDKNCLPWAQDYFKENLTKVSAETGDYVFYVTDVRSVSGDCDVTQRKGKVRCIFELNVDFVAKVKSSGNEEDEEEEIVISLPEFEHDQDEDDYRFEIKTNNSAYKKLVKTQLIPEALKVFMKFQPDLLYTHEAEMKHNTD